MATRQFFRFSIEQLERLFDEKRENIDVLTSLLAELSHRTVPRANDLQRRVLQALSVVPKSDDVEQSSEQHLLTVEEHRRLAVHLRKGKPDWNDRERAAALQFAKHHEFLAELIERRTKPML